MARMFTTQVKILELVSWKHRKDVKFQMFTAMKVNITVFLNLAQCSLVDSYRRIVASCLQLKKNLRANVPEEVHT
jgi:hypothetical protein